MAASSIGHSELFFGITSDQQFGFIQDLRMRKVADKREAKDAAGVVWAVNYTNHRIRVSGNYTYRMTKIGPFHRVGSWKTITIPKVLPKSTDNDPDLFDDMIVWIDSCGLVQRNRGYGTCSFEGISYLKNPLDSSSHFTDANGVLI